MEHASWSRNSLRLSRKLIMNVFKSAGKALITKGFLKALGYSAISAVIGGLIAFFVSPDIQETFPWIVFYVPVVNAILVWLKQFVDELKTK